MAGIGRGRTHRLDRVGKVLKTRPLLGLEAADREDVIPQSLTDAVQLDLLLHARLRERLLPSDAGAEEELGRAERSEGDDDLLGLCDPALRRGGSGLRELDASALGAGRGGGEDQAGASQTPLASPAL